MYIHLIELVLVLIMTNKKELVPPFTHFTADTVLYLEHSESSGEYEKFEYFKPLLFCYFFLI